MPRRSSESHAAASAIAAAQDGLITAAQLEQCNFPPSTVNSRIRAGGPWLRVLPGVYDVARVAMTVRRRHRAALLYAGPGAILTARSALERLGLRSSASAPSGHEVVLIDHGVRRQSAGFVIIERTRRLPEPRFDGDLAYAPDSRAVIDLARHCRSGPDVDALVTEVIRRGVVTLDALASELKVAPIRGSALARSAIAEARGNVMSGEEAAFRRTWRAAGLPTAAWNVSLFLPSGQFLAKPDAYIAELALAVEVDSRAHHAEGTDWASTLHRHSRMTAAGIVVLHYTPQRIRTDGDGVVNEIRQTVETLERSGRIAPPITVSMSPSTRKPRREAS